MGRATAALLALAAVGLIAQTPSGALKGKLTDLQSRPLAGVTVTLTNRATGAEALTVTSKGGAYRFPSLAPGEYALQAAASELGSGHLDSIHIDSGHESRIQVALAFNRTEAEAPAAARTTARGAEPKALVEADRLRAKALVSTEASIAPWTAGRPSTQAMPETTSADVVAGLAPVSMRSAPLSEMPVGRTLPDASNVLSRNAAAASALAPERRPGAPGSWSGTGPETQMALMDGLAWPRLPVATLVVASVPGTHMQAALGAVSALAALSAAEVARWAQPQIARASDADEAATTRYALTGEQLQELPLAGRDWESLILEVPPAQGRDEEPGEPAHGNERRASAVTVDRSETGLAFGERSQTTENGRGISESAIQEVRFLDPGDASGEYRGGAAAQEETRAGRRGFHGQLFVFNRQAPWAARNPLALWVKESAAGTGVSTPEFSGTPYSPSDRQIRWGGGLGSALHHGRVFWFAALDGLDRDHPAVSTVKHFDQFFAQPTNDEMQVLSARLGLGSANPVVEGIKAYSGLLESVAGLLGPASRRSNERSGFARLDWRTAERHRFTLEGSESVLNAPGAGLTQTSETYGIRSFGSIRASHLRVLGRWEAYLTPNVLVTTQGTMRRSLVSRGAETPTDFEKGLNVNAWGQLPQMRVDSRYGITIGNPARFGPGRSPDEHVYEAQESLSWVHGSMLFRAGFQWRHNADATSFLQNHTGTYFYSRIENFASDALVFSKYGLTDALDSMHQHNCDPRGKAWRDSSGQLHGLGYLPCYSYYTQTLGPTEWHLSTNDWAGFVTTQWQPAKRFVMTASLRWDREELPPPIGLVDNPDLPLTRRLPQLGNQWSPRVSMAWGTTESHLPVLRLGYGLYAGRTNNAVVEDALTRTGSLKGDLNLFMRPTDNLQSGGGGAPPFPYVLGGSPAHMVKPGAVEFADGFRNAQIQQGLAGVDVNLPGRVFVSANATVSLARRLPVSVDTNYDPGSNPKTISYMVVDPTGKGPTKTPQITVPFFATWPEAGGRLNKNYQQITQLMSKGNSTYEAGMVRVSRYARNGLSFHVRYIYGHAMDWNPNEGAQVTGSSVFDPTDFQLEYGTSDLDVRHSASAMVLWQSPRRRSGGLGWLANGWTLSGTGRFSSGLPYTMRTEGSIPKLFETSGAMIVGLGPGMNGFGGDDRVYGVGRNTYRHPATWKADMRMGHRFRMGRGRELELLAETFNLFNHRNVIQVETVGYSIDPGTQSGAFPRLNFLSGLKTSKTEFGRPLTANAVDSYRERQFDLGLRMRF